MNRKIVQPKDVSDLDGRLILRDGRHVAVPHANVTMPHGGLGGTTLVQRGPDRVVLRRTVFGLVVSLLLMGFGLFVLAELSRSGPNAAGRVLIPGFAAVFILTGLCGLLGLLFNVRGFRADRRLRTIEVVDRWWRKRKIPFDDVGAVQITWYLNRNQDPPGTLENYFLTWEINLVLAELPLERIPLVQRGGHRRVYAQAEHLAGFLGVPLLDHSE
jgi:hypothetical protein